MSSLSPTVSTSHRHSSSISTKIKVHKTTKISALESDEPAFLCTICWQPQPKGSKPKLLGSSARIVCKACWRAVLDLSICWVCGECIVRGDDVVSLGWCFWHRGCFGCLVCGTTMDVPVQEQKSGWGEWDGNDDGVVGKQRCIGVELEEIPLCAICGIETSGESQEKVLEKGLEAVSKYDGGLSKDRVDLLSEVRDKREAEYRLVPRRLVKTPIKLRRGGTMERDLKLFINGCPRCQLSNGDTSSLLDNAADMGTAEDGSADHCLCQSHGGFDIERSETSGTPVIESKSEIYVSIFDPINDPPFVPSKTKPLPKWMQLLPNNVHREREERAKAPAEEETRSSPEVHDRRERTHSNSSSKSENVQLDAEEESITTGVPCCKSPSTLLSEVLKQNEHRSRIAFEPLPKRSDRRSHTYRQSEGEEAIYMTPPEFPSQILPRQRTPFPRIPRPTLNRQETTCYFSHRPSLTGETPTDDVCCAYMQELQGRTESERNPRTTLKISPTVQNASPLPISSSEYIEKHQPKLADDKHSKYVAKAPESILHKIKRQKMAMMEQDAVKQKSPSGDSVKSVRSRDEDFGRDLNKELRNLFGEE